MHLIILPLHAHLSSGVDVHNLPPSGFVSLLPTWCLLACCSVPCLTSKWKVLWPKGSQCLPPPPLLTLPFWPVAQHLLTGQRTLVRSSSRELREVCLSLDLPSHLPQGPFLVQKISSEKERKCSWLNLMLYTLASVPGSTLSSLPPGHPHFQSILQFSLVPFD